MKARPYRDPEYPVAGCQTSLGEVQEINTDGCHYELGAETNAEEHAQLRLECGEGSITVKGASGCILEFPSQTFTGGTHYANENEATADKAITSHTTIAGTYTSSGFICALGGVPAEGHFTYEGRATLKGDEYLEGTTTSYVDGQQVGIWWE